MTPADWYAPGQQTLTGILESRAMESPDRVAVRMLGENISYAQIVERSNAFARGLRHLGVERGDVVAVVAENSSAHVYVEFAAARLEHFHNGAGVVFCKRPRQRRTQRRLERGQMRLERSLEGVVENVLHERHHHGEGDQFDRNHHRDDFCAHR